MQFNDRQRVSPQKKDRQRAMKDVNSNDIENLKNIDYLRENNVIFTCNFDFNTNLNMQKV